MTCAALIAVMAVSCGTSLTTADGSKFTTYSNGKKMALTMPNGASLHMEGYDHAGSILAAGQAVATGAAPVADIIKTGLWTRLWGLVSHDTKDVANNVDNNKTDLAKTVNNNKTSVDLQANHNSTVLGAQAGGAEVQPAAIK